nr:hypothetical protein [Tanacetum cinerariifolium]
MNMGQDKQMQMVGGNGGNQFRQYAGQNAGNPAQYNDVIGNQVIQNAVQNPRVQNFGNQNGLIGVQWNGNQNQIGNGNMVAVRAEGNAAGQNENQIRCYNCRGMQIVGGNSGNQFRQYAGQNVGNLNGYNAVQNVRNQVAQNPRVQNDGNQNQIGNGNLVALLIAQKEEAGIQLQAKEYDLMAAAADLDEIEEVNANCILMANLQQASSSEQHSVNFEETCALYESLYQKLADEVEKVNSVNRKLKETNADLTTELA